MKRINIYKPLPKYGHKGDSFHALLAQWEIDGYINLLASPDRYIWWNAPGNVLLHDHDLVFDVVKELPPFKLGLFGNLPYPSDDRNTRNWILWGRHPQMLEKFYNSNEFKKLLPQNRMWESIFIGKVENQTQFDNRFQTKIDWTKHIHMFAVVRGVHSPYPFTPYDYLWNMSKAKFALLLPGYGPKCNRDIEACATGAVPIVTPGVSVAYYNEWIEGENFLRLEKESDMEKILKTDHSILEKIQQNNYRWYEENCTSKGAFELTKKIIEEGLIS